VKTLKYFSSDIALTTGGGRGGIEGGRSEEKNKAKTETERKRFRKEKSERN